MRGKNLQFTVSQCGKVRNYSHRKRNFVKSSRYLCSKFFSKNVIFTKFLWYFRTEAQVILSFNIRITTSNRNQLIWRFFFLWLPGVHSRECQTLAISQFFSLFFWNITEDCVVGSNPSKATSFFRHLMLIKGGLNPSLRYMSSNMLSKMPKFCIKCAKKRYAFSRDRTHEWQKLEQENVARIQI